MDLDVLLEDPVLQVSCAPRRTMILTESGSIYGWGDTSSRDKLITISAPPKNTNDSRTQGEGAHLNLQLARSAFDTQGCWKITAGNLSHNCLNEVGSSPPHSKATSKDATAQGPLEGHAEHKALGDRKQYKCTSFSSGMWHDAIVFDLLQ